MNMQDPDSTMDIVLPGGTIIGYMTGDRIVFTRKADWAFLVDKFDARATDDGVEVMLNGDALGAARAIMLIHQASN